MSRGHGAVERAILDALEQWPHISGGTARDGFPDELNARDLARLALNTNQPTRSQIEAVRRAARRLTDQGLLEELDNVEGAWGDKQWTDRDYYVGWRKPWTPAQRDAWYQICAAAQGTDSPVVHFAGNRDKATKRRSFKSASGQR